MLNKFTALFALLSITTAAQRNTTAIPSRGALRRYVPTPFPEEKEDSMQVHKEINLKLKLIPFRQYQIRKQKPRKHRGEAREKKMAERDHKFTVRKLQRLREKDHKTSMAMARAAKQTMARVRRVLVREEDKAAAMKQEVRQHYKRLMKRRDSRLKSYAVEEKERLEAAQKREYEERELKREKEKSAKIIAKAAGRPPIYQSCLQYDSVADCERKMRKLAELEAKQNVKMERQNATALKQQRKIAAKMEGKSDSRIPKEMTMKADEAMRTGHLARWKTMEERIQKHLEVLDIVRSVENGSSNGSNLSDSARHSALYVDFSGVHDSDSKGTQIPEHPAQVEAKAHFDKSLVEAKDNQTESEHFYNAVNASINSSEFDDNTKNDTEVLTFITPPYEPGVPRPPDHDSTAVGATGS